MTQQEFENVFVEAMNMARKQTWFPYDTGNMALASFKGQWFGKNKFRIYFDENIAPYVYYTNERWNKGRNPHENWIENKLIPFLTYFIAKRLNAERVGKR